MRRNKTRMHEKAAATPKAKAGGTDWRILRTKPALALGLFHLASDIGAPCSNRFRQFIDIQKHHSCTKILSW